MGQDTEILAKTLFQYLQPGISKCSCFETHDYQLCHLVSACLLTVELLLWFSPPLFSIRCAFSKAPLKGMGRGSISPSNSSMDPIIISEFWSGWSLGWTKGQSLYVSPIYSLDVIGSSISFNLHRCEVFFAILNPITPRPMKLIHSTIFDLAIIWFSSSWFSFAEAKFYCLLNVSRS